MLKVNAIRATYSACRLSFPPQVLVLFAPVSYARVMQLLLLATATIRRHPLDGCDHTCLGSHPTHYLRSTRGSKTRIMATKGN